MMISIISSGLKILLPALLVASAAVAANGDDNAPWHHKKCAVCLTYDDALNVHLDHVIPALDSLGFRGTFYVPVYFPGFHERLTGWKNAAGKGHELGNHTIFHPCEGKSPGREWVNPDYDLNGYTVQRMMDEIKMADIVLRAVDGRTERTFAYTCGDTMAGDSSFVDEIKKEFVAARGVKRIMKGLDDTDLYDIGACMINGESADEMTALVREAMNNHALLVFLFHGVGGEHSLNVSLDAHSGLLHFLKQNEKDIWVAPLRDIAEYVKTIRSP